MAQQLYLKENLIIALNKSMWGITGSFSLSQIDPLGIWVFWQSPLFWFQGKGNDLELVWMGWVLSDITQFSISIIQIVWVQLMSICLHEFWIIVSITLSDELWKLKTHFRCFQFQSSIFNGIFVIKLTYPATMFDKQIFFFFFFLVKPSHNFWSWKLGLS